MSLSQLDRMRDKLQELVGIRPEEVHCSRAPGRIEVLGNHTDYNGGFVLAATIDKYVWSIGCPTDSIRVYSHNIDDEMTLVDGTLELSPLDTWHKYVKGVIWALRRRNYSVKGFAATIFGNVPLGGGLSSSAALEVSLLNLIANMNGLNIQPKSAAMMAYEAERMFCGVACGIMDQFASQLGKQNALLGIDCRSMHTYDVPFNYDASFLVVDSMVSRDASSALNARRAECNASLKKLQENGWKISSLSEVRMADLQAVEELLGEPLSFRVRHVVLENERVRKGASLLLEGDLTAFGEIMVESHRSSRDLYEVSHPNIDFLVETALEMEGTLGARLSGAGLGGNMIALVKEKNVDSFTNSVKRAYEKQMGIIPNITKVSIPGGIRTKKLT